MTHLIACRTFPPLNIALYNAFGGTGDELYGVEPPSYYVMNLILMLNPVSFLLAVLGPLLIIVVSLVPSLSPSDLKISYKLSLFVTPAFIWLGIMFSRPHKVSSPCYPSHRPLGRAVSVSYLSIAHHNRCGIPHNSSGDL